jgi:hypothetical protein
MTEFITPKAAAADPAQVVRVWFQTTQGKIGVRLTINSLFVLRGMIDDAIARSPVNAELVKTLHSQPEDKALDPRIAQPESLKEPTASPTKGASS